VWKLFPRGHIIKLSFWDYNDVAPGYFAAAELAAREKKIGIITIEVARPDLAVADRNTFADTDIRAAAKGLYVIRDFASGPRHGYIVAQGASATFNLIKVLPTLQQAGINVKVISAVSEELFDRQPASYRNAVLPDAARQDLMFVMSGTRRMWPLRNVGAQADEYSMTADWGNDWLTGGLEADVIAEAHLDADSIFAGVRRFATERASRLKQQRADLGALGNRRRIHHRVLREQPAGARAGRLLATDRRSAPARPLRPPAADTPAWLNHCKCCRFWRQRASSLCYAQVRVGRSGVCGSWRSKQMSSERLDVMASQGQHTSAFLKSPRGSGIAQALKPYSEAGAPTRVRRGSIVRPLKTLVEDLKHGTKAKVATANAGGRR
jgi:hypothetical protein